MCKTFKLAPCNLEYLYSIGIVVLLLPILYVRSMAGIGYFSMIILVFTFVALGIIFYMSITILMMEPEDVSSKYPDIELTAADREYNKFDGMILPVFAATMMCLFEGN